MARRRKEERGGPPEDLLRSAVKRALSLGANYAEARYQLDYHEDVRLRNGHPVAGGFSVNSGIAVRVIVDGAMGFASTNRMKQNSVRNAVERSIALAKASAKLLRRPIEMSEEELGKDKVVVRPRVRFENVDLQDRVEALKIADQGLLDGARRAGVEAPSRFIALACGFTEKHVISSDGADVYSWIPRVAVSFYYQLTSDGRSIFRHKDLGESRGWEGFERWRLDDYLNEDAGAVGQVLKKAVEPPEGEMDVVLGPEVVGLICHESAGHPGEADRMLGREAAQAGETYIKPELLGSRIGSDVVTVVDDPTVPGSYGFYVYDEEGVRARERVLIEKGVLKELLQNRETAAVLGTKSNGASRASSYDREPIVRMANTYMKPGDHTLEELIEGIAFGVYIKTYSEWNIDDKRWNQRYTGVEAYLIRNGRLAEPVYKPILEITTKGLYSSIDAVGKDLEMTAGYCGKGEPMQAIPVWFGGPSVRVRRVRLLRPT